MAKPKAQTLQQRFGFMDEDLKTPGHDEILFWLETNRETILKKIMDWKDTWSNHVLTSLRERSLAEALRLRQKCVTPVDTTIIEWLKQWHELAHQPPPKPVFEIECKWEYQIMSGSYLIGFVDMGVFCRIPKLMVGPAFQTDSLSQYRNSTARVYPDWRLVEHRDWPTKTILFEAKTVIPSLGELLRQINMYRAYNGSPFYVVSPEDKFKKTLLEQQVGLVKYPSGEVFKP